MENWPSGFDPPARSIDAARAARIGCVIGVTSNRPAGELAAAGADATVENLGRIDREGPFGRG